MSACSGGSSSSDGSISISLTDRPIDGISALNITVTEFWVKPQGSGPAFQLDMVATPVTVNLLELSVDDPAIFVDGANIPAGTYNWMEMVIDDSDPSLANAVTNDGAMREVDVDVPSNRIRLINQFDVAPNDSVRMLFDWDVRQGMTEAVGRDLFILKPVIRVLDVLEFGSIVGEISSATVMTPENGCNADSMLAEDYSIGNVVYVFEGDVEPGEIGVVDPYATVDAKDEDNDGDYEYRIPLMPGTYTFAATCQGGIDSDEDDGLDSATFFLTPTAGDSVVTFEVGGEVVGPTF